MSIRGNLEQGVVGLLAALVGDGDNEFKMVGTCTKSDILKMVEQETPDAPFALVSYAGKNGGFEGEHHQFSHRVSVFVGGYNYVSAEERRHHVYELMDAVESALWMKQPIVSDGVGLLEETGDGLTSITFDNGIEVWEMVFQVIMKLSTA